MAPTASLDRQVVKAARRVRVLGSLTWPQAVQEHFLASHRAGNPCLPEPPAVSIDPTLAAPFADVVARADRSNPRQAFIARTADAYLRALAMLQSAGTPAFSENSLALYGGPNTRPVSEGPTVLTEAEHLLASIASIELPVAAPDLSAEEAQAWLQTRIDEHFARPLPVVLDPALASLASAGANRVRLQGGTRFRLAQLEQLLQHEALVHTATKRNGRAQKKLRCLGLSSPRTTAVQEGLATLSELITDSLDVRRLRRIALRVVTVNAALEGADFLQVYEMLREAGQSEDGAFRSASRIFRGGDVRGRIVFTKDTVYLQGLRRVHTFLLTALRNRRPELPTILFAGRMTCADTLELAPLFASGVLQAPETLPPWVARTDRLAAYLAWAAFGQRLTPVALSAFERPEISAPQTGRPALA